MTEVEYQGKKVALRSPKVKDLIEFEAKFGKGSFSQDLGFEQTCFIFARVLQNSGIPMSEDELKELSIDDPLFIAVTAAVKEGGGVPENPSGSQTS